MPTRIRPTARRRRRPPPPSLLDTAITVGAGLALDYSANLFQQAALEEARARNLSGTVVLGLLGFVLAEAANDLRRAG